MHLSNSEHPQMFNLRQKARKHKIRTQKQYRLHGELETILLAAISDRLILGLRVNVCLFSNLLGPHRALRVLAPGRILWKLHHRIDIWWSTAVRALFGLSLICWTDRRFR